MTTFFFFQKLDQIQSGNCSENRLGSISLEQEIQLSLKRLFLPAIAFSLHLSEGRKCEVAKRSNKFPLTRHSISRSERRLQLREACKEANRNFINSLFQLHIYWHIINSKRNVFIECQFKAENWSLSCLRNICQHFATTTRVNDAVKGSSKLLLKKCSPRNDPLIPSINIFEKVRWNEGDEKTNNLLPRTPLISIVWCVRYSCSTAQQQECGLKWEEINVGVW